MAFPTSLNDCCSCWPWCKTPPPQAKAYEASRSVLVAPLTPPQTPPQRTASVAHVRFASTEQVSLTTALRQAPPHRMPTRDTGRIQQ